MKRLVIIAAVIAIAVIAVATPACAEQYVSEMAVYRINRNIVWFIDSNGEVWVYEFSKPQSVCFGQVAIVVLNDRDTASIYDDAIVSLSFGSIMPIEIIEQYFLNR